MAYIENGACRFLSKCGNAFVRFGELAATLAGALRCRDAILDGEITACDDDGKPHFLELLRGRAAACYVAFDPHGSTARIFGRSR